MLPYFTKSNVSKVFMESFWGRLDVLKNGPTQKPPTKRDLSYIQFHFSITSHNRFHICCIHPYIYILSCMYMYMYMYISQYIYIYIYTKIYQVIHVFVASPTSHMNSLPSTSHLLKPPPKTSEVSGGRSPAFLQGGDSLQVK